MAMRKKLWVESTRRKAGKWLWVCKAVGRAADCFKGRRASRCLERDSNRQAAEKSGI